MPNYNLPKHASNRLAVPIPGNIQKILWIVILSLAMLVISATAIYANSATADDNVSDAPPTSKFPILKQLQENLN